MKVNLIIIGLILTLALFLMGGFISRYKPGTYTPLVSGGLCCDSGDGEACKPATAPDKTITYGTQTYGLIRSKVSLIEGNIHLKDSGKQTPDKNPIILNSSESHYANDPIMGPILEKSCRPTPGDMYFKKKPPSLEYLYNLVLTNGAAAKEYCTSIPDDEIIFACRENCHPAECPLLYRNITTCYGDEKTIYDVYFRLSDYHEGQTPNGIPDFVKNCDKSIISPEASQENTGQQIVTPAQEKPLLSDKNLHLKTFSVIEKVGGIVPWLSPFCKPAIYLYPEEKTNVHVQIKPQGNLTLTIPLYPHGGWNVTAYPSGTIESLITSSLITNHYDYLYYEAEIPNDSYTEPKDGYVVEYTGIYGLLHTLLPKLGLNAKETQQFSEYWTRVLPSSPYYFIGIIPQTTLDTLSPLEVSPSPKTVIRVTLYFKALDKKEVISEPVVKPVERHGFTVVEWGGIFKRDKDHPFSCFM